MRPERVFALAGASLICVGLAVGGLSLTRPIGQDETINLMAARLLTSSRPIAEDGVGGIALLNQPPLYHWLVSRVQTLLGPEVWAARIVGWLGYGLTGLLLGILVGRLVRGASHRGPAVLLSLALYLLNPVALQGIAITDIDPAVLPAWTVLWILVLLAVAEKPCLIRLCALAIAAALGFFSKLSTPGVVVGASIVTLVSAPETRRVAIKTTVAAVAGAVLFAGGYTLWGTGRGLGVINLVRYISQRAVSPLVHPSATLANLPQAGVDLSLWMSPWLILVMAAAIIWGLASADWRLRLIAVVGGILMAGYLIVGGTPFGFPKYHAPALPILCALVGLWGAPALAGADHHLLRKAATLGIFIMTWNVLVVGDLLLVLRYEYRWAVALGDPTANGILRGAEWRGLGLLAPLIPVAVVLCYGVRGWAPRLRMGLIVVIMGSILAVDVIQGMARYGPSLYGEASTEATANFLRARLSPSARVIATTEILFYLGKLDDPSSRPPAGATWNEPSRFLRELTDPRLEAVVYGIASNTINQYHRVFRDPAVLQALQALFQRESIGGYTIWWRSPRQD